MVAVLDSKFWDKLSQISSSVGMNPEDLMAVMYYESGLDPTAHNKNGNASGLIQFMPDTLNGMGFTGSHKDFRQLDATKQLDYVRKYVTDKAKFNGGGFKSATQYYVANLWPIALKLPGVQREDPNTIIIEANPTYKKYPQVSIKQEHDAYEDNAGLDVNKDGKITYGDLQAVMAGVKKSSGYRQAVQALHSGNNFVAGNAAEPKQTAKPNFLDNINNLLDKLMSAVAKESSDELTKRAQYKKLPLNNFVIQVQANELIDSLEFARVLCTALDEECQAKTSIFTDRKNVQVLCGINGPAQTCKNAVTELCRAMEDAFKTATMTVGTISIKTSILANDKPSYQELDIKLAQSAYRQFHLKFIR